MGIAFVLVHLLKGSSSLMMASISVFLALVLFWGFAANALIAEPFLSSLH